MYIDVFLDVLSAKRHVSPVDCQTQSRSIYEVTNILFLALRLSLFNDSNRQICQLRLRIINQF